MIDTKVNVDIPPSHLSMEDGYQKLAALLEDLAPVLEKAWYVIEGTTATPFTDKESVIALARKNEKENKAVAPDMEGFSLTLTTAYDKKTWEKPGKLTLNFLPRLGLINVEFYKPNQAFVAREIIEKVFSTLRILALHINPTFGFVDIVAKHPIKFLESYKDDFAAFPHRKCLGWMGFVPQQVTAEQLPLAFKVENIKNGTLIVAIDEVFDLDNTEHIKRANQIEMDMVDAGVLPVTDPSLM